MITQRIEIDVAGASMPAYLARPEHGVDHFRNEARPAVIVLHEVYGINDQVRHVSALLTMAGYVALAPNYYHRTEPNLDAPYTESGTADGFAAASHVSKANMRDDIAATVAFLAAQPFVDAARIATWGFCFGGTVAFVTADSPALCGAISFYAGNLAKDLPNGEPGALVDAASIRVPMLLAFGAQDPYISADDIRRVREALADYNTEATVQVYEDAGHAFFRERSENLSPAAALDAWELVSRFLSRVFA